MKQFFLSILFSLLATVVFAQNTTIKGRLIDGSEKKPLPYATISVAGAANAGQSIRKFATDDNGGFTTSLPAGNYIFTFQFVGMNSLNRNVEVKSGESRLDLGNIELQESSTELQEISVTAQRPLVKVEIDKLTYSAKDDPESSTSNVLDLLRKVPLVTVDGEDKIQLKGSSNFKIYMNGKPSNMISSNPSQVLKSMPANSIKDIEVITDPGARYDAEGVGGIINIITDKRVDEGYSGSVGANGDTMGGYGGNGFLSLKYGKFGFTGNGAYFHHNSPNGELTATREETLPARNLLTQKGTQSSNGGGLFYNTQLSYEPDTLNLFNLSVGQFGGKFYSDMQQHAQSEGARNYAYDMSNKSMSQFGSLTVAADYQRSFKKKGELLTLSYRFEQNPNDSEFESAYENVTGNDFYYPDGYRMKSVNDAGGVEHTGQVDYVNPISQKHSIEAGFKYIFRDNTSRGDNTYFAPSVNSWKEDVARKNDLDHEQRIASGYLGYTIKMGKTGLKLGLRGENTNQKIHFMTAQNDDVVPSNFFDLVPSAAFSYQLGMTQTLRWGYNMRISRPGIRYLNPYVNNANPDNISYGNPDLTAEKTHNINVNYGSFSQKLNYNVTLSYSFTRNSITSFSFVDDQGVNNNTYRNIGRNNSVGLDGFMSWMPVPAVRMNVNASVNYVNLQSMEDNDLSNSGFTGRAFSGLTYTLPNDLRFSLNGGMFMGRVQLQTTQSAFYFYSFSAMKSLFNKKLDVSLSATSPFHKFREFKSTTRGEGFMQTNRFLNPMRNFRLSLTYRFGDLKTSVRKVQRTISNEDVIQGNGQQGQTGGGTVSTGGGS